MAAENPSLAAAVAATISSSTATRRVGGPADGALAGGLGGDAAVDGGKGGEAAGRAAAAPTGEACPPRSMPPRMEAQVQTPVQTPAVEARPPSTAGSGECSRGQRSNRRTGRRWPRSTGAAERGGTRQLKLRTGERGMSLRRTLRRAREPVSGVRARW